MAKEKVQILEVKESERVFHYEILGIVLLILSMLAIAKLGLVGKYLMLITKLLFGDWFFIIYGLIIAYSIRCILIHKRLNINNVRYLGIFILYLAIILLSHFNVHNFIKEYEGNHLVLTIRLYFNYFKNEAAESITGGGIVGATFFYLFYYLFSSVGVICLSIILIFLGIVFITKKTIKEFVNMIINLFKNGISIFNKTSRSIKEKINQYDASYKKSKLKYKIMKVDTDTYYKNEEEFTKRNVEIIKKVLNSMNIFYNEISYIICRNVTTFFITSHFNFSYEAFRRNLSNYFHTFQLKKDDYTGELLIELNNITPVPLRIGEIRQDKNDEIIFGIDDRNEFLRLENSINKLFVCGKNKKLITEYFDSVILSLIHSKNEIEYHYVDLLSLSKFATSNSVEELDHILVKINERITKFNNNKSSSIIDYNNNNSKHEKYRLVIINGLDKILYDQKNLEKIMYMLEVTQENGYLFMFSFISTEKEYHNLYNLFNYRFFLDNESEYAKKCLEKYKFDYLNKETEGYLLYKSIAVRACMLLATKQELESIK